MACEADARFNDKYTGMSTSDDDPSSYGDNEKKVSEGKLRVMMKTLREIRSRNVMTNISLRIINYGTKVRRLIKSVLI